MSDFTLPNTAFDIIEYTDEVLVGERSVRDKLNRIHAQALENDKALVRELNRIETDVVKSRMGETTLAKALEQVWNDGGIDNVKLLGWGVDFGNASAGTIDIALGEGRMGGIHYETTAATTIDLPEDMEEGRYVVQAKGSLLGSTPQFSVRPISDLEYYQGVETPGENVALLAYFKWFKDFPINAVDFRERALYSEVKRKDVVVHVFSSEGLDTVNFQHNLGFNPVTDRRSLGVRIAVDSRNGPTDDTPTSNQKQHHFTIQPAYLVVKGSTFITLRRGLFIEDSSIVHVKLRVADYLYMKDDGGTETQGTEIVNANIWVSACRVY